MKLKLYSTNKFLIFLNINQRIKSSKIIIPIGCDCHPAYMLHKLGLRKMSLPFDWLDTQPLSALNYANQNITQQFTCFMADLKKNNDQKVIAKNFPEAVFFHFDDLIENKMLQQKLLERADKLLNYFNNKPCYFLHCLPNDILNSEKNLNYIVESIRSFNSLLKQNDNLFIYSSFAPK